ncbi:MAG TPA: Cof-type HAD-IIB family hydrolase [Vicinamibacterales bacterium]|nr:Cof-type HAD-IIB family hydrolase [Vicinamibacterales bacterium]
MIRLLALDIDGTLLDSRGHLPAENREAIGRAIDAGVEVALATGRRYDFARPIFEQLPYPLTLILSNGALVKTRDGDTLMRRLLPRAVARDVLAFAPEHRAGAAVTFDRPREGQIIYEAIDWEHPQHRRFFEANRPFLGEASPLETCLVEDPVQVMFTGPCAEMRDLFNRFRAAASPVPPPPAAVLQEEPGHRYSVALTEYEFRDFSLVDVLCAGCSKGSALRDWARTRGYRRDEVMAVGDNLNDIEMLEFAGTPVVMGNAIPDLHARGWTTTATNDAAGVARAVETLILRRAS